MTNYSLSEIDSLAKKATRGAAYSWGMAEEVGKAVRWLSAYGFLGAEMLASHLEIVADKSSDFIPHLQDADITEKVFNNRSVEKLPLKNLALKSPAPENRVFHSNGQPLCALYCGALINDLGHHLKKQQILSFDQLLSPLLALPSAARIAEAYNASISFSYDQTVIICNPNGIVIKNNFAERSRSNSLALSGHPFLLAKNKLNMHIELNGSLLENTANIRCERVKSDADNTHFPSPKSRPVSHDALAILEKFAHKTYAPATEASRLRGAG